MVLSALFASTFTLPFNHQDIPQRRQYVYYGLPQPYQAYIIYPAVPVPPPAAPIQVENGEMDNEDDNVGKLTFKSEEERIQFFQDNPSIHPETQEANELAAIAL